MNQDARRPMKTWLAIVLLLLVAAGCAHSRPDWIESTLVTVDVSGVWRGRVSRAGGVGDFGGVELTLQQNGAKVTGQITLTSLSSARGSRLEGTVSGDVFTFRTQDGTRSGELQVNGDEMSGMGTVPGSRARYELSRRE